MLHIYAAVIIGFLIAVLFKLHKGVKKIMSSQAEFDAKLDTIKAGITAVLDKVATEGQQIRDYIAANPTLNTSGLDDIATRLESVGTAVAAIFEPPTPEKDA